VIALAAGCKTQALPPGSIIVDRVDVLGAERVDEDDIEAKIATAETKRALWGVMQGTPLLTVLDAMLVEYHTYDRLVLERDLERVRRFYRARGFYDARVHAGRVIRTTDHHVRVEIEISEGEPVLVEDVELDFPNWQQAFLSNAEMFAAIGKFKTDPLEDGEPLPRFDEDRYDALKQRLVRALTNRGFAYAKVEGEVTVDLAKRRARIRVTPTAGPRCTFGAISLEGLGEIPDGPVLRELGFESGDGYSTSKMDQAQFHLANLGVFGTIEIAPELGDDGANPPTAVPVRVRLSPIKLRAVRAGVGAGFGARVEVTGILGWEDRNFLGGLRRFSVDTRPGLVFFPMQASDLFSPPDDVLFVPEAELRLSFKQPAFPERRTNLLLKSATRIYQPRTLPTPDDFDKDQDNVVGYREIDNAVGFERKFLFDFWRGNTIYAAQFIKLRFDDPFSYNLADVPDGFERVLIPYLETVAAWDFRKNGRGKLDPGDPRSGFYFGLNAQFAGGFLQGDADDVRLRPEMRFYASLTRDVVVAFKLAGGFLFPRNYGDAFADGSDDEVARARDLQLLSFRGFFSGGPSSNRGYLFRDVGPHETLGFLSQFGSNDELQPTGGLGLWELGAEVRIPFADKFVGVVFVDGSDVVRALSGFRLTHPHIAPGIGVRYKLPIGRLRFDWGFRPPYMQRLGEKYLEPEEGGPDPGIEDNTPFAFSLAIGEAF
jgi:outer membrane protein assembly factor BamA